jgi:hypothetical protein
MNYLDKKTLTELKKYEEMMAFVVRTKSLSGYKASDINNIYNIYTNATKDNINYKPTCSNCVFRLLDRVGRLYFDSQKYYESQQPTEEEKLSEKKPIEKEKTTKRKYTKKKK